MGFETPSPVQEKAIPVILGDQHDLVVLAQTGTGKTAAFGLPLLQKIDSGRMDTQVLILSPTRELCMQIGSDLKKYAKYRPDIRVSCVYGGTDIRKQMKEVKQGVHVIVATPGRLVDMINRKAIHIENVFAVVLDEADEMLNMGFQEDLDFILSNTPKEKNTYLFSATMPKEVERIAKNYLVAGLLTARRTCTPSSSSAGKWTRPTSPSISNATGLTATHCTATLARPNATA